MKKVIILVLSLIMAIAFVACSGGDDNFNVSITDQDGNPTPKPAMIEAGRDIEVEIVKIIEDDVNVRKSANTGEDPLGKVSSGQYFLLIKEGDEWDKIEYFGAEAYVYGEFCEKSKAKLSDAEALLKNQTLDEPGVVPNDDTGTESADGSSTDESSKEESSKEESLSNEEDGLLNREPA